MAFVENNMWLLNDIYNQDNVQDVYTTFHALHETYNRYMYIYIYVIQRWLQRYTVLMYNKGNSYLHAPATTKNQYPYLHWNWISHRWCWTLYRCTCKLICHPLFSIKNDRISKVCVVRTQTGQYRYKFHSHCLVTQVVRAQAVPNGG